MADNHPRWIVRERGQVLTIEVVAGMLVLSSPNGETFVAAETNTVLDMRRKLGLALTALADQQGVDLAADDNTQP
jgi:hypothetical protein